MRRTAMVACVLLLGALAAAQAQKIDTQRSTMTVKVGKSGLFSAFGHNHEIRAPIVSGMITRTEGEGGAVELTVDARKMKVLDPDISDKDRAEVQRTMETEVLEIKQYPEIRFVSQKVEPKGDRRFRVTGELTLHGMTRPVAVNVEENGGRYSGSAKVKQTQFGIKPVTAGGGTVKVKDEVEIVFEIVPHE